MKTYKEFITEGVLGGYRHKVIKTGTFNDREKHVFDHKDYQVIINAPDKTDKSYNPKGYNHLRINVYHKPTASMVMNNTYNSINSSVKNDDGVRWSLSVVGNHFEENGIDEKKKAKILDNVISHVNKHIGGGWFSSDHMAHL